MAEEAGFEAVTAVTMKVSAGYRIIIADINEVRELREQLYQAKQVVKGIKGIKDVLV